MTRGPALLAAVAVCGTLIAQEEPDIRRLIEQLGADDYQARLEAERRLESAGDAARPFLEEASRSSDLEVRKRAIRILARIEFRFLRDGELARWDPALVEGLLSSDLSDQLGAGEDLVARIERGDVPHPAWREADRVLLRLVEIAPTDRHRVFRIGRIAFGDPEGILEFARAAVAGDGSSTNLGFPLLQRYDGPADPLIAALEATEGAERTWVELLLCPIVIRDDVASPEGVQPRPRSFSPDERERLLVALRRVPPEAGVEEASVVRSNLELLWGDHAAIARVLRQDSRWIEAEEGAEWLRHLLEPYRDMDRRRELIVAAWDLPADRQGVLVRAVLPWFAEDPLESLESAISDPSPRVRETVALAIGSHRLAGLDAALRSRLADDEYEVRLAAAWALGEVGGREEGLVAARRSLDSGAAEEVRDAMWTLLTMGDPDLGERARAFLSDPRPDVRAGAAFVLADTPEAILGLLSDPAPCRYYPFLEGFPIEGTVDEAIRDYLRARTGRELPESLEGVRAEVRRWREDRGR